MLRHKQLKLPRLLFTSDPASGEAAPLPPSQGSREPAAASDAGNDPEIVRKLNLVIDQQREITAKWQTPRHKDVWDKIQASGALLVGVVGILFTFVYQRAERHQREALQLNELTQSERTRAENSRLAELKLFSDMLTIVARGDERQKVAAIRALSELGSPKLAAIIATIEPSPGTAAGLNTLRAAPGISAADRAVLDSAFSRLPKPLQQARDNPKVVLSDSGVVLQPAHPADSIRNPGPPTARDSVGVIPSILDIRAPRGTPVLAAANATVTKLVNGTRGGLSIYLTDEDTRTRYYYAHLERFAEGLREGQRVQRGSVIGYVGDTGNYAPGDPHLHFSVAIVSNPARWWEGENGDGWWEGRNAKPTDLLRLPPDQIRWEPHRR